MKHSTAGTAANRGRLARPVGPLQFFALSFGCTVGSGWVIVLGDWLEAAGPGGAMLGFGIGATVMLAVAACYAELASRLPSAGGEIVYAYEVFGPRTAFFTGWFLTLSMIATGAFEGTALGWICTILWPELQGPVLYHLFGEPVHAGSLTVGIAGTVVFSALNYAGVGTSTRFQTLVTFAFLLISFFIVVAGFGHGRFDQVPPWWQLQGQHAWWLGVLWIIGTVPFFLNGFQAAAQAIEERTEATSFKNVAHAMYAAVVFAGIFYIAIVLACSMAAPWASLINTPMATAAAMNHVIAGGVLSRIVLIAAAISILKTWNGVMLWAARLLLAQGRAGFIPQGFAAIHPRLGSPYRAVMFVAIANLIGITLGRGALLPIVGMAAICLSASLVVTCVAVFVLRLHSVTPAPYAVPGGTVTVLYALVGSGAMAIFALILPWMGSSRRLPLEWTSMITWGALGAVFWLGTRPQRTVLSATASLRG